ncbi:MAG: hypothetical protein JNK75_08240 [Betaproteobacteria bacterium]|nr:hypothetical protein [Betaproteobacteria bacterium]
MSQSIQRYAAFLCGALWLGLLTPAAVANDVPNRVARLAWFDGAVSLHIERDEGWREARINAPLTSENSVWTEGNARAEVRLGASAFRLHHDTVLDFARIADDQVRAYLQRGSVQVRVRQYRENDFADKVAIDTPNGVAYLESDGRYRIDVDAAGGGTRVTVFVGRARFEQDGARLTVDAGRELAVRGNGASLDVRYFEAQERDLDRWAEARDARWDRAHTRYVRESTVSPYMTGYEELDDHGDWFDDGEYGRVWAPRVTIAGWAPYRYGHWSHVRPWGWTWIDDAPWGFAPFHYGRWVQIRNRWCWWPGTYHPRPAYAPALVAWYGHPGAGVTITSGIHVGWFPLAPREHFIPRYPHSRGYVQNINYVAGNVTIVQPPRYRYAQHGATFVPNEVFTGGRQVGGNFMRDRPAIANPSNITTHVDLTPRPWRDRRVMPDRPTPTPTVTHGPRPAPPASSARVPPPVIKYAPDPIQTGPAVVPPQPSHAPAPVVKRAPEPILVGPAVAPAPDVRPLPQVAPAPSHSYAPAPVERDRGAPGPRVRGGRQPVQEGQVQLPRPSAPVTPAPIVTTPSGPSHGAPTPKPKPEPAARPKERDADGPDKPRSERSGQPKSAHQ